MNDYDHITVDNIWRTDAPWGYDLTSVTIGNDITSIGDYAFIGCQQLSSLSIGDGGFRNCVVINSTVTGSRGNKGAIIGLNDNSTLRNLYLYGDNQNRAVGYGGSGTNVGRARKVTIGSGISSVTPAATDMANGFVYNNDRYYREGLELTLASNLSATGKHPVIAPRTLPSLATPTP